MKKTNRWLYAAWGVLILLFAGLIYAWSVLSAPIAAEYSDWSKGAMSLTFTMAMSFFCLGGLIAGLTAGRLGERVICSASALMFLSGFMLVSEMTSLVHLYIGFGVLAGLGAGFAYNTVMGSVTRWFPDKKGLISGILLMGFGIGAFVIGKAYAALLSSYSWRTEFKLLSVAVCLVILIGGLIIRKPSEEELSEYIKADSISKEKQGSDFTTPEMLKGTAFWLYFLYAILLSASALALVAQASGIVLESAPALTTGQIATIVGLISVSNGIGRVIFGGLYDRLGQRRTMLLNCVLYLLSVLINITALKAGSLPLVILGYVFFGLSYGGVTPTNSAFIMDFYGVKHYPVNFSIINLNLLLASFGGTAAGVIYDRQGSYMSIFLIMLAAIALAMGCALLIKRPGEVQSNGE